METVSIILNFILGTGLAGTFLFFKSKRRKEKAAADSAEIENLHQVIRIQSEQLNRLDGRLDKLETKVERMDEVIERKNFLLDQKRDMIRQAFKCGKPADECPVLQKRKELKSLIND